MQAIDAVGQTPHADHDFRAMGDVRVVAAILDGRAPDSLCGIHAPTLVNLEGGPARSAGQRDGYLLGSVAGQHQDHCSLGRGRRRSAGGVAGAHPAGVALGGARVIAFGPFGVVILGGDGHQVHCYAWQPLSGGWPRSLMRLPAGGEFVHAGVRFPLREQPAPLPLRPAFVANFRDTGRWLGRKIEASRHPSTGTAAAMGCMP